MDKETIIKIILPSLGGLLIIDSFWWFDRRLTDLVNRKLKNKVFNTEKNSAFLLMWLNNVKGRKCMGARKARITGSPDKAHISTSHMERQNLSMRRMGMRRFTRLTNAFSKKVENQEHMVALYFTTAN
jgi:IS1 family transposase